MKRRFTETFGLDREAPIDLSRERLNKFVVLTLNRFVAMRWFV